MAQSDERAIEPMGERYAADPGWRKDVLAMLGGMKAEGLLPKGMTEQAAFLVVTRGRELGMQPMEALASLYVVNGRVALEGEAMIAAVHRNNLGTIEVQQATAERAQVLCRNRSGSTFLAEFSIEDAARAGLNSDPWRKFPQMMLLWRAVSWGCRVAFPELFNGLYTREEAEALEPVPVAYTVTETPTPAAEPRFLPLADILAMQKVANVPAAMMGDVIAGMGFSRDTVPYKLADELTARLQKEKQASRERGTAPSPKRTSELEEEALAAAPDAPEAEPEAAPLSDPFAEYEEALDRAKPEEGKLI